MVAYDIVFILSCGIRWLNVNNNVLRYTNEAVLPFFVLQQPVIIVIAFYVVQWDIGVGLKWLIISTLALALTMAVYELLIRRVNVMRWLFGMKPHHRTPQQDVNSGWMQGHQPETMGGKVGQPVPLHTQEEHS